MSTDSDHEWVRHRDRSQSLQNGFIDHGPVGFRVNTRGWVSTHDGNGNDVVLVWLRDANDGWLGMITIDTGEFAEFHPNDRSMAAPYASLLSTNNRFYACNHHFVEFDPSVPGFTFVHEDVDDGTPYAMSMTEDDAGIIWAATYPDMTLVRFDPEAQAYTEFGPIYEHPSAMYPRSIAADAAGWIYVAINPAAGQLLIVDRDTGDATPVLSDDETATEGPIAVTRATDGAVYAEVEDRWIKLEQGVATELDEKPAFEPIDLVTGPQSLRHRELPSGGRVSELALGAAEPYLEVETPTGSTDCIHFQPSGGDVIPMRLAVSSDGTIVGGSSLPVQLFRYDPAADSWQKTNNFGQWNVVTPGEDSVFVGMYPAGALLEWDPTEPWNPPAEHERDLEANPAFLANSWRHLHRPFSVLAHPNGRDVIMGGQPDYGHTGGGLLIWDRQAESATVLTHEELIEHQIPRCLASLPDGTIFGGTDTHPAGGGVRKADCAQLFEFDLSTHSITWTAAPLDDVDRYQDLTVTSDGTVLGIADGDRFFVFDPAEASILHEQHLDEPTIDHQGPHIFVEGPEDRVFVLFRNGRIAEYDPTTYGLHTVATSPMPIRNGGGIHNNRLFFATDTNVYSWNTK